MIHPSAHFHPNVQPPVPMAEVRPPVPGRTLQGYYINLKQSVFYSLWQFSASPGTRVFSLRRVHLLWLEKTETSAVSQASELSQNGYEGVASEGHPVQQCPGGRKQGGLQSPLLSSAWCWGAVAVTTVLSAHHLSRLCFFTALDVTQQHKCENSGKTKQMLFDKK